MSAMERLEQRRGETPPQRDPDVAEVPLLEAELTELPAKGRARLRPLLSLMPYVARYRGRAVLAFIALTISAITTLLVPIAVRRVIDFGFTPEGIAMINSYFSVMIALVAV
ncbi:MAG: ABC transporter, partial [Bradyrhizobium sp.]|nr:ABC transporter [Bradyrhizobium sp.]